jgi:hypothetical protein
VKATYEYIYDAELGGIASRIHLCQHLASSSAAVAYRMSERNDEYRGAAKLNASPEGTAAIAWWLYVVVILGALLTATGAILALVHPTMLVSPYDEINGAVHIYAGYLASRNMALAVLLVVLLSLRARRALGNLMVLVALIQLFDACMDCAEGRWMIAPGVLVFGMVFLIGATRLSGHPFWRSAAWAQ